MKKNRFKVEDITIALRVLNINFTSESGVDIKSVLLNNDFLAADIVKAMLFLPCANRNVAMAILNFLGEQNKRLFIKMLKDADVEISRGYDIFSRAFPLLDSNISAYLSELAIIMKSMGYSIENIAKLFILKEYHEKLEFSQVIKMLKDADFEPKEMGKFVKTFNRKAIPLEKFKSAMDENALTPEQQKELVTETEWYKWPDEVNNRKVVDSTQTQQQDCVAQPPELPRREGFRKVKRLAKHASELTIDDFTTHDCDVIVDSQNQCYYVNRSSIYVKQMGKFNNLPHSEKTEGSFVYDEFARIFQYVNSRFIRIRPQSTEIVKENQTDIRFWYKLGNVFKLPYEILGGRAIQKIKFVDESNAPKNIYTIRKYVEKHEAIIPGLRPYIRAIYDYSGKLLGYFTPRRILINPDMAIAGEFGVNKQVVTVSRDFSGWDTRTNSLEFTPPGSKPLGNNPPRPITTQWRLRVRSKAMLSEAQLNEAKVAPLEMVGLSALNQVSGDNECPDLEKVLQRYQCFVTTFRVAENLLVSVKLRDHEHAWGQFNILSFKNMIESFDDAFKVYRLCHHDIKSGNLGYDSNGNLCVIDWECAKLDKDFKNGLIVRRGTDIFTQYILLDIILKNKMDNPKLLIQLSRARDLSGMLLTIFDNYLFAKTGKRFFAGADSSLDGIQKNMAMFEEFVDTCIAESHRPFLRQFLLCEDESSMFDILLPQIYDENADGVATTILQVASLINWAATT